MTNLQEDLDALLAQEEETKRLFALVPIGGDGGDEWVIAVSANFNSKAAAVNFIRTHGPALRAALDVGEGTSDNLAWIIKHLDAPEKAAAAGTGENNK